MPVLGDLPLLGRFFRKSAAPNKNHLVIFVTPTIIDPAGNRVQSPEDLPIRKSSVPPQKAGTVK